MTTCLDYATRALRALGVIGAGQAASGDKGSDALQHLQNLIDDMPGLRKGRWTETILTSASDYDASDGERINTASYAATIVFPTTYVDPDGVTAALLDLSRIQIIGGAQAGLWLFSASTAAWSLADGLELSDSSPFGPEDDGGLVALLAVAMAPEYGEDATLSNVVVERAARQQRSLRARFRRQTSVPVDNAMVFMSNTGGCGLTDPLT